MFANVNGSCCACQCSLTAFKFKWCTGALSSTSGDGPVNKKLHIAIKCHFEIVEEFKRAVLIATGGVLGDHIVNTMFELFDIDGMLSVLPV